MEHSYEEIDRAFFQDGYHLAKSVAGKSTKEADLAILGRTFLESLDVLLDSFNARIKKEGHPLDCRKGCSWCCTQPVFTNDWEAAYLRQFMRRRFTGDKLVEMKIKAEIKDREVSGLPREKMLKNRIPCPLLQENVCSVYPARPAACRIYLSMDVDSCMEEFRNPSNEVNFAKLYDFPLHAGRKMNEGIASWLEENGMEIRELRLEEGLLGSW